MDLGSGSDGDDSRPPRIFEIVRESPPNGGPETGVNMVSSSVCVEILNFRGLSKNQVEIPDTFTPLVYFDVSRHF